jgi:hypothetical protein
VSRRPRARLLALALPLALIAVRPLAARQAEPYDSLPDPTFCRPVMPFIHGLVDHATDFARVAELGGAAPSQSWTIQRPALLRRTTACAAVQPSPWSDRLRQGATRSPPAVAPLPLGTALHYNSAYPRSRNNGALWAGRGMNWGVHGGVHVQYGGLSATIAPVAWYQANQSFDTHAHEFLERSPYAYVGHLGTIDWPQRHGDEPFWTIDPGQSQLSFGIAGARAGVSSENLWWGPVRRNPLLMSANAPGVPRLFVGTDGPLRTPIGSFELDLFWGVARESDYFDFDPDNDRRLFAGIALAYQPAVLPGLSLGIARAYMNTLPPGGIGWSEFLLRPYRGVRENPLGTELEDNQLISVFGRWALPAAGVEFYAEWGREDHWADFTDFISEPDHSQGYALGFQKVFPGDERWVRVAGELTHLQAAYPYRGGRFVQTWYIHSTIQQGYTHRGQLLGAPIGPGSDAQYLEVDVFHRLGRLGAFLERARYDDDAYFNNWGRFYGMHGHDVELTGGLRQVHFWRAFDASWQLSWSWRRNRHFIGLDGENWDFRTENNIAVQLGLVWRPGL